MSKVVVNLRLDKGLVERIDGAAGPRGRTKWVVAAVENLLAEDAHCRRQTGQGLSESALRRPVPGSTPAVDPRPVPSVDPRAAGRAVRPHPVAHAQFVRAASLVTPQIKSEWDEIMASRQARLNKHRDDAA